jgi:signal transduction histidine kinase
LPDCLFLVDADHNVTAANSRALTLLGRKAASTIGRPIGSVLRLKSTASGSRVDMEPLLLRARSSGKPVYADKCLCTSRAGKVEVALSILPVDGRAGDSQPVALVLNTAATDTQPLKLRDTILSMVSHELRTPLLHIKGFVSSLLESDIEWDEETRLDFLRTIDREADRLTAMVNGLMEISRMGTGELPLHLELADPYQLTYAAVDEASPFLHRHRVVVEVPEGLPKIRIDVLRVMGVLVNLIENASKYSGEGSLITLDAEEKGGEIVFSVADQGIGVPGEIQETIFDMFYRGQHGGKRSAGTGLGLAVCKAVVEAHHGKIWVESEGDGGSTFYFTVPLPGSTHPRTRSRAGGISRARLTGAHGATFAPGD